MDKIDKLLDAIEHPEHYCDSEIQDMFNDHEVSEVLELLDMTRSSLRPIAAPDVNAEWDSFKTKHYAAHGKHHIRALNLFTRNMAASIAIGIASLAAVATVVGVSVNCALNHKEEAAVSEDVTENNKYVTATDSVAQFAETAAKAHAIIVFENEQFEYIINQIAEYYDCTITYNSETPKSLRLYFRWNQALSLEDVIDSLNNFEQIHITVTDNTISIN